MSDHGHSHEQGGHSHSHGPPQGQAQQIPRGPDGQPLTPQQMQQLMAHQQRMAAQRPNSTIQLPPNANYTPPSSVDSLLNLHDLSISDHTVSLAKPSKSSSLNDTLALLNRITQDLLRSKIENNPPPPPQPQPNNLRSGLVTRAKDDGNAFFKQANYPAALQKYNIALQFASTRPLFEASVFAKEEMSVILSNRSATYMALGCHVEALCDAEAIVGLKKGWPKGYFRKGKALVALGNLDEARDAFIFGLDFEPNEKVSMSGSEDLCAFS